jgi:hypothetical protein
MTKAGNSRLRGMLFSCAYSGLLAKTVYLRRRSRRPAPAMPNNASEDGSGTTVAIVKLAIPIPKSLPVFLRIIIDVSAATVVKVPVEKS